MVLKQKVPLARVSESSRRDARTSPGEQVGRLRREREEVVREKTQLEYQLAEVEQWKHERMAEVFRRRLPKSLAIEKTNAVELEYINKRNPLIKNIKAIEERLHAIRGRLHNKSDEEYAAKGNEQLNSLRRIEGLLAVLIKAVNQTGDGET